MTTLPAKNSAWALPSELRDGHARDWARYAGTLVAVALVYFGLAKAGLALASINPSASPVWPPSGFALAAVLLWGHRIWPAVFIAAFAVNAATAGSAGTALAIATGNTLECLVTGALINRWSGGLRTFDTPIGVVRFAGMILGPGPLLSATLGVGSLALAGYADRSQFTSIWLTWWLGDAAGALVLTPAIVLWATSTAASLQREKPAESAVVYALAAAVGIVAFSPLLEPMVGRGPLSFLAVLPLIVAALRCGPRDTAGAALILAGFAVWGTAMNSGPFAYSSLNDSFLLLLAFIASTSFPSLVLSADVAMRKRIEEDLRTAHEGLDRRVQQRTVEVAQAIEALQSEVEDRRSIETELQEQRVHLQEAQRLADLGSWSWDIRRNKVTWSQQLFDIYGLQPDEFSGTFEDYLARVLPEDRERVGSAIRAAFQSGTSFRVDERIVRPDGEIRHLRSTGEVIRNESGDAVQMLGVCHDVTERRDTEAALDETREKLAQSQKMEALGQLTGGIAHDFNNLLMIVSGHAQILRRGLTDPQRLRAIDAIAAAAGRGESLTRQLLAFSRRQPLSPVVVDLKERIEAVREMLGRSLRGNIEFSHDLADGLWPTEVDPSELELALVNIAVNARDAMPEGGKIALSGHNVTLTRGRAPVELSGDFIAISMADTGTGIPRELLPKVFEPFFTTKSVDKGTGLGLSQVYGFAHQSGGAVTIDSEVGRGTTVTLYLPRSAKPVARIAQASRPRQQAAAQGTILVVEDNSEVAHITSTLLEELGYRVLHAGAAAEALERLQSDTVDLVFSDIVMPGQMDGIALAREIRTRYPDMPVLLTSGYSETAQAADVEFTILRKPFQISGLDNIVREALQRRRLSAGGEAAGSPA